MQEIVARKGPAADCRYCNNNDKQPVWTCGEAVDGDSFMVYKLGEEWRAIRGSV
jgi:hypothetical protein